MANGQLEEQYPWKFGTSPVGGFSRLDVTGELVTLMKLVSDLFREKTVLHYCRLRSLFEPLVCVLQTKASSAEACVAVVRQDFNLIAVSRVPEQETDYQ